MERNVKDSQELSIVAMLTRGEPKNSKVEFVFVNAEDSKELKKVSGELVGDVQYSTAKTATCKFKPDPVPDDKDHYTIKYKVVCDKQEFAQAELIKVWPATGKLEAKSAEDQKALPNFQFKVVQTGLKEQPPYVTDDKGAAEFRLQEGAPFTIQPITPFEVKKEEKAKPRQVKLEAIRKFTPCFVTPALPNDGKIKQWINQTTAKDGQDGLGSKVKIKIAVKEDLENPAKTKIGGPGVFAWVKVKFGGSGVIAKSKRKTPKTELIAAGITDLVAVTDGVEYTGKVELKAAGAGEFEVELGKAGGDTCEISLGCTKDVYDPKTLTFTNWRKVYYEVRAPKTMTLPDAQIGGKAHKDLPNATRGRMVSESAEAFVEWVLLSGEPFDLTEEMKQKHLLPAVFAGKPGNGQIFQLTDNDATKYLTAWAKAAGGTPMARFILCSTNYYFAGDGGKKVTVDTTTKIATMAVKGWLPRNDKTGDKIGITWTVAHVHDPKPVTAEFTDAAGDNGAKGKNRIIRLEETQVGTAPLDIAWQNPTVGHTPTDITPAHETAIKSWLTAMINLPNRRIGKNKLKIKVISITGDNDRRKARIDNVKAAVNKVIGEIAAPPFDPHPGMLDDGKPRTGQLDPDAVVDMTKSTFTRVVVNLPDTDANSPGKLVGAESDDKCPITVVVRYVPHGSGLGTAFGGARRGDLLVVNDPNGELCTADTILHELGHLFALTPYKVAKDGFAPGVDKRMATEEAEADFKHNGDKGHYYDDAHGGTGTHCAYGLSDADKTLADYDDAGSPKECIMFASGPSEDNRRAGVVVMCPQCLMLQRARDYSTY